MAALYSLFFKALMQGVDITLLSDGGYGAELE